ncbi:putative serine/threonine-protein kinase [Tetrabaena socialis]|uniref:Putative serine/threonine-protein kinase n=1 Tax=Tetrabaena socialis TaxID=47790 RepID=A0A2J7ZX78_9CHLO|nr:putative serine/threonine-protein kinase [Tetrabaena socialis]|eukprot:PNH04866.1 putative serine/threonine-protein kinase [Tetrabaena socialis]
MPVPPLRRPPTSLPLILLQLFTLSRPAAVPGIQSASVSLPQPDNCTADAGAPVRQRCWANRGWMLDVALTGASVEQGAGGITMRPTYIVIHLQRVVYACEELLPLTDACVAAKGLMGCALEGLARSTAPPTVGLQPPPPTALPRDGLGRAARPSPPQAAPDGGGGGASSSSALGPALGGALGGNVSPAAGEAWAGRRPARLVLVAGVAALLVWRRRISRPAPPPPAACIEEGKGRDAQPQQQLRRSSSSGGSGPEVAALLDPAPPAGPHAACSLPASSLLCALDSRGRLSSWGAPGASPAGGRSHGHDDDDDAGPGGPSPAAQRAAVSEAGLPGPTSSRWVESQQLAAAAAAAAVAAAAADPFPVVTPKTPHRPDINLHLAPAPTEEGDGGGGGGGGDGREQGEGKAGGLEGGGGGGGGGGGSMPELTLLPVVLGRGSYGRVVEGLYGGQRVAVKLVPEARQGEGGGAVDTAGVSRSFEAEVTVLGRCQHPNVVRLLAACMTPPRLCLVMELMDTTLERMVVAAPGRLLPLDQASALHPAGRGTRAGIPPPHRGAQPANILVNNPLGQGQVAKLTDFGLSRLACTALITHTPEAGTGLTLISLAYRVTFCGDRPPLAAIPAGRRPARLLRLMQQCWDADPQRRPAAAELVKEVAALREMVASGAWEELALELPLERQPSGQPDGDPLSAEAGLEWTLQQPLQQRRLQQRQQQQEQRQGRLGEGLGDGDTDLVPPTACEGEAVAPPWRQEQEVQAQVESLGHTAP